MNQPHKAPDSCPKIFLISISNSPRYSNSKVVLRGIIPRRTTNHFQDRGLFEYGYYKPWVVWFIHANDFRSVPLKRMSSPQNFFVWFCGVLICLWGLIPCRTKSCEVLDPAEQDPAGYQTQWNQVLRVIRPCRTMTEMCIFISRRLFCGVWYPAEQRPAGPDTPQSKVLRGIRPRGTKFCGISDPREQL
jgi:hypothetical protein